MNFGQAIEHLKDGGCIARADWTGKGMRVFLNKGSRAPVWKGADYLSGVSHALFDEGEPGTSIRMPNLNMRAADGSIVTGWLPALTDILAEDWMIAYRTEDWK